MAKSDYANVQKIICYLRRSRQDMERERRTGEDTLSTQKKIMAKVLDDISISYDMSEEIGSGDKIETRPVFQEVLKWLREGRYNAIAVKEIARLGRGSYSDMGEIFDLIKEKRTYIITPYKLYDIENPSDARQIRFELFFAREEFEMIRERMLSSKLNLAHEGRWVIGATPYGYALNSKTTRLEIVEEEANIVRMIFDLYAYGMAQSDGDVKDVAFRAIAGYLNRLGIPSPRNGKNGWSYLTVQRVIGNVAYTGTVKYRTRKRIGNKYYPRPEEEWIVVENAHEPIIMREVWNLAQDKLNGRRMPHTKLDFSPLRVGWTSRLH
ncbi:MAG: recombinase family protein [Bacillota bacterium]